MSDTVKPGISRNTKIAFGFLLVFALIVFLYFNANPDVTPSSTVIETPDPTTTVAVKTPTPVTVVTSTSGDSVIQTTVPTPTPTTTVTLPTPSPTTTIITTPIVCGDPVRNSTSNPLVNLAYSDYGVTSDSIKAGLDPNILILNSSDFVAGQACFIADYAYTCIKIPKVVSSASAYVTVKSERSTQSFSYSNLPNGVYRVFKTQGALGSLSILSVVPYTSLKNQS